MNLRGGGGSGELKDRSKGLPPPPNTNPTRHAAGIPANSPNVADQLRCLWQRCWLSIKRFFGIQIEFSHMNASLEFPDRQMLPLS